MSKKSTAWYDLEERELGLCPNCGSSHVKEYDNLHWCCEGCQCVFLKSDEWLKVIADSSSAGTKKRRKRMRGASALRSIPFPKCANDCETLRLLGATECESVCSWRFNLETGDPVKCTPKDCSAIPTGKECTHYDKEECVQE